MEMKTMENMGFKLIPESDFYNVIDSGNVSEDVKDAIELWYVFLSDLVMYEDFLSPELQGILGRYRNYVTRLQVGDEDLMNGMQKDACNRLNQFETNKLEKQIGKEGLNKDKGMVLKKEPLHDNAAFVSCAQVFGIIFAAAAILSAVVIYVIGK